MEQHQCSCTRLIHPSFTEAVFSLKYIETPSLPVSSSELVALCTIFSCVHQCVCVFEVFSWEAQRTHEHNWKVSECFLTSVMIVKLHRPQSTAWSRTREQRLLDTQQSARMRSGKEMSEKYAHNLLLWDRYFSSHFSHFSGALGAKSPDPLM